jgi:NADH-quinone oxidoreductase subunit K
MMNIQTDYGLVLAAILFAIGLTGVLVRRDMIFILFSLEILLNSAGLAFIAAGAGWAQADGQIMFIFILASAASEVAVALALLLLFYERHRNLDADSGAGMKG